MVTTESKGAFCAGTATPPRSVETPESQTPLLAEPVPTMPIDETPTQMLQDSQTDPGHPLFAPDTQPGTEAPPKAPESEVAESASAEVPPQRGSNGRDPNYFKLPDLYLE